METTSSQRAPMLAGLLIPGAGQAIRGDLLSAVGVFVATVFFWMAAVIELIVANQSGYPAPLVIIDALQQLNAPLTILPQLVFAVLCALTMHIGAAILAARAAPNPTA